MGVLGKVFAISFGVFVGGGLGFILKETVGKKFLESKKSSLITELEEIRQKKRIKEQELGKKDNH